jgi:hypothetical protein
MTTIPTADQLFIRATQFPVIICRRCEYAIRPKQVIAHLTSTQHRIPITIARQVAQTIDEWDNIHRNPDELQYPMWINQPIDGLQIYHDGILCKRGVCGYICRSIKNMKKHWRTNHNWSAYTHAGRPQLSDIEASEQAIQGAMLQVTCQRLFAHSHGSHYMHVRQPGLAHEPAPPPAQPNLVEELMQQLEQTYADAQASDDHTIQAGPLNEANPWLRRTQWATYLQGAY